MANFLEDDLAGTVNQGLDTDNLLPEVPGSGSRNWVVVTTAGFGPLTDLLINGAGTGVYTTAATAACYNEADPGTTDYEVVATVRNGNDADNCKAGVTLRNATGSNASRYAVEWDNNANVIQIVKFDSNNGATTLDSDSYSGPGVGNTFELKGTVSGSATTTIKAYVDGVEVLSYDDSSSPITAGGRAGISLRGSSGGDTQIMNVTAAELVGADGEEALTGSASTGAQTAPAVNTSVAL
jgi:hypothetical protein